MRSANKCTSLPLSAATANWQLAGPIFKRKEPENALSTTRKPSSTTCGEGANDAIGDRPASSTRDRHTIPACPPLNFLLAKKAMIPLQLRRLHPSM
jgi:hypothetical protein